MSEICLSIKKSIEVKQQNLLGLWLVGGGRNRLRLCDKCGRIIIVKLIIDNSIEDNESVFLV